MLTLWFAVGILCQSDGVTPPVDPPAAIISVIDGKGRGSSVERAESSRLREEARRNAVERAWQSVFEKPGVEAPPEKPSARQKDRVVAVAMRELDVSGLQASARELKRLIDAYAIERHRQKQHRDAMIILLMSA
jgi:hypothetical protein